MPDAARYAQRDKDLHIHQYYYTLYIKFIETPFRTHSYKKELHPKLKRWRNIVFGSFHSFFVSSFLLKLFTAFLRSRK